MLARQPLEPVEARRDHHSATRHGSGAFAQPTLFYASALVLAVAGQGEGLNVMLAWADVGSRAVHSLL